MQAVGEIIVDRWPDLGGEPDELRLVKAALAGDHAAFDALVRRHEAQVASVIRRAIEDPNDLEDAVQETFLRAYQNLRRFRGDAALRTWLLRIALNVCHDRRRGWWKRRVILAPQPGLLDAGSSRQNPLSDPAVLHQVLGAAVDRLPDRLRLPFVLHVFEELSGAEIAVALRCRESTVWSRIYAARKQLRKLLAGVLDE